MPLLDYSKPADFCESVEAVIVLLQYVLVQLRDHAAFDEELNIEVMNASALLSSVLDDMKAEIERLHGGMEAGGGMVSS